MTKGQMRFDTGGSNMWMDISNTFNQNLAILQIQKYPNSNMKHNL